MAKRQDYIVAPDDLKLLEPRCIHISTALFWLVRVRFRSRLVSLFSLSPRHYHV